jgi:exodeoxyribonuclease VII small subunit
MSADAPADPEVEPEDLAGLSYAEAIDELEQLLEDLERDEADVDELAEKVRRAAALIRFCRSRITSARVEIDRIVTDLE